MRIIPNADVHDTGKNDKRIVHPAGVEVDLPAGVAKDLIARGFAVAVNPPKATPPDGGDSQGGEEDPAQ